MLKQDRIMYTIISEIVHGEKQKGESIRKKDYDITGKQMTIIFKKLADNDVIERSRSSCYSVTGRSADNAQEFCLSEISKILDEICNIAEYGNISDEMLIEFIRMQIKERKQAAKAEDNKWVYTNNDFNY